MTQVTQVTQLTLDTFRTIARCDAIYRSRFVEADLCKMGSDYFNTMVNQTFDDLVLKEFKKLEDRISELSWANSPDRSGGQFTDEEINRNTW